MKKIAFFYTKSYDRESFDRLNVAERPPSRSTGSRRFTGLFEVGNGVFSLAGKNAKDAKRREI
ncbi:MAG: hypothetical protein Q4A17_01490 [Thermoguttaceae bacterium]|nr:hypothetical protein [Thermoguttaceae bacterium]